MRIKLIYKDEAAAKDFDFYTKSVKKAFPAWPEKAINIVADWYYKEDAASDFRGINSFSSHVQVDLPNMLDAVGDAGDASYIKQVMADTSGSDMLQRIRRALKAVFPSYKYRLYDHDDGYACIEYVGSNKIPEPTWGNGLVKLQSLLPGIEVRGGDSDDFYDKSQIEFFADRKN